MASAISRHATQYRGNSMEMRHPKSRFGRSPWEKIEHRELNKAPVTLWIGVASVIVAISIPDIDLDDLFEASVHGTRLLFRGATRSHYFSQDVELPCAVEPHPIYITGGKGILSILLARKQEVEAVEIIGHDIRYNALS